MNKIILKFVNFIFLITNIINNKLKYLQYKFNKCIKIEKNCKINSNVIIRASDGGKIYIGKNVNIGSNVEIISQNGQIYIDDNVFIGKGTVIVSLEEISIGKDTLIAENVTIRDQDHNYEKLPLSISSFLTTPIRIGKNVWIGAKVTILRGSDIGDQCVIGANSLVRIKISNQMVVAGVPARIIKKIDKI
jgi:acetyltransferase-like isoleucine patch superfamily enzyme